MNLRKLVAAGLMALVAAIVLPGSALADPAPDPQLSNVPYLAWRGSEVRLVKCDAVISPTGAGQRADLILVDWSGEEHALAVPHLEAGSAGFFAPSSPLKAGQGCVRGTFVSQKAGLAQIKLVVSSTTGTTATPGTVNGTSIVGAVGTPVLKHDFLIGYMNINTASLAVTKGGTVDVAGGAGNQLQVLVTGTIPLRANFRELGLGDTLTMPDDWARLANVMAGSAIPEDTNVALKYWDIHDEFSPTAADTDLHGAQSACPVHNTTLFVDTVDNCTGLGFVLIFPPEAPLPPITAGEIGFFSRVWQGFVAPTLGPFDPQRPQSTLLSNGVLDKGDAPMPSARVDFRIAANSGAAGDTSGVGSLAPADKHVVYSRNGLGTGNVTHNLYAPFYAVWLPSTAPALLRFLASAVGLPLPPQALQFILLAEASGVDGPANLNRGSCGKGNNFAGYLNQCAYHFWDIERVLARGPGGNSTCLQRFNTTFSPVTGGSPTGPFTVTRTPVFRQLPGGPQTVAVYTDEHGEARIHFIPGLDFFFGNLGIAGNLNLGCELQNTNPIGTARIQAVVRYPFEPVTAQPVTSNAITKTVTSAFNKIVRCVPKGTNPNDQFAQICLAEARDITGLPGAFIGEIVCFASNAELIQHFRGSTGAVLGGGGITVNGTLLTAAEQAALGKAGAAVLCQRLDAAGRAAVEVFGKGPSNLIVDFVDEGLIRVITFNFASGTGATGTSEITSTATPTAEQIAQVNNAPTQVVTPSGTVTNTPESKPEVTRPSPSAPSMFRIDRAELVQAARGKASLLVKVRGPAGKVGLRIRISAGRQAVTAIRAVQTNRLVKVPNLRTPTAKGALRLSVAFS